MRRHPRHLLLGGLVLAALGCGSDEGPVDGPSADERGRPPYGPGVEVGETYRYELHVHCGVRWAPIDGTWWETAPLDDGHANPPDGWGNPFDGGQLEIVDEGTAVYVGQADQPVTFTRTERIEPPSQCL